MIKDVLSIRGEKVVHFETGECLALLNLPIVHPDTGVVEAFWVKPLELPLKNAIILASDIIDFKKSIYIRSEDVIHDPAEIIKIATLLDEKRDFLYAMVQNEKGKRYGRIYNLSFSTETYVLRQIYTKRIAVGLFSFDFRVFPYERVLKVLPQVVIIDDEVTKKEKVIEAPVELA